MSNATPAKSRTEAGRFTKGRSGNPMGRAKGTRNTRTVQWEELGRELTNRHADNFNALLDRLWASSDLGDQVRAAELFLKLAEYFKPKLQRSAMEVSRPHELPQVHIVLTREGDLPEQEGTG